jgi:hypothetical protein
MKIIISCASAVLNTVKNYIPKPVITRLTVSRPTWRDLGQRLIQMPLMKRGHFTDDIPNPDNVDLFIAFAEKHNYTLCYGYKVRLDGKRDYIDTVLMCLDDNNRIVEDAKERLNHTCYYVGIRIPAEDIKSRKYAIKFERMDYVLKNMER